jgi:hypothetical protein
VATIMNEPLVSPLVTRGFKLMECKQYMDITIII